MTTLADAVARALLERDIELGGRWRERALAAAPRRGDQRQGLDEPDVTAAVRAVVGCLVRDARWQGEVMRTGWDAGAAAYRAELSVHHLVSDADLLLAVVLAAVEQALPACAESARASAADGFALARRMQRAGALYAQAALSGFMRAVVAALRQRWRLLRHDLRNPLGTIQSALSLMSDDSLPLETRTGSKVRAMVVRNAGSLEHLIATRLSDASTQSVLAAVQEVSVVELMTAARRVTREATRLADCDVLVADATLPRVRLDVAAFELTLVALLLAFLGRTRPGDIAQLVAEVRPGAPDPAAGHVLVTVAFSPATHDGAPASDGAGGALPDATLQLVRSLAEESGGRLVDAGDALRLEFPLLAEPLSSADGAAPAAISGGGAPSIPDTGAP